MSKNLNLPSLGDTAVSRVTLGAVIAKGDRVRLRLETDDLPAGSLGTVSAIVPGDDDKIHVVPDNAPHRTLVYYWHEVAAELEVVNA